MKHEQPGFCQHNHNASINMRCPACAKLRAIIARRDREFPGVDIDAIHYQRSAVAKHLRRKA